MPQPGDLARPADLRDRPEALYRVRGSFRRAAVRAGVPGELHPGGPEPPRDQRDAVGEIPASAGRLGLADRRPSPLTPPGIGRIGRFGMIMSRITDFIS